MSSKIITASIVIMLILAVGGGVWYFTNYLNEPKGKTISAISKKMKTYISKAGFTVSYPKEWYLNENSGTGWRIGPEGPAFTIANKDPNYYIPRGGDNIEIFFNVYNDLPNSPSDINKKLEYYAKKYGMRTVERINIIKKRNVIYCLAHGQPRGYTEKYQNLFFYLPKSRSIGSVIIYGSGKYSIDTLLDIIIIQVGD